MSSINFAWDAYAGRTYPGLRCLGTGGRRMHPQDEINESEWRNPANWRTSLLYFGRRDDRVWVPKRFPGSGDTLNLARPLGLAIVLAIVVLIVAFVVTAGLGY